MNRQTDDQTKGWTEDRFAGMVAGYVGGKQADQAGEIYLQHLTIPV